MAYDFSKLVLNKLGKIVKIRNGALVPMVNGDEPEPETDPHFEVYEAADGSAFITEKDDNGNYLEKLYSFTNGKDPQTGVYYISDGFLIQENPSQYISFEYDGEKLVFTKRGPGITMKYIFDPINKNVVFDINGSTTDYTYNPNAIVKLRPAPSAELNGTWYADNTYYGNFLFIITDEMIKYFRVTDYSVGDRTATPVGEILEITKNNTSSFVRTDNNEERKIYFTVPTLPNYEWYTEIYRSILKVWVPKEIPDVSTEYPTAFGSDCVKVPDVEIV